MCLAFLCTNVSASTLYMETFFGEDGKGEFGDGTSDFTGVDWTLDVTGNGFGANPTFNHLAVQTTLGSEKLRGRRTNGGGGTSVFWFSPTIDISGQGNVDIYFDLAEDGGLEEDGTDFYNFEYQVDSGGWTRIVDWFANGDTDTITGDLSMTNNTIYTVDTLAQAAINGNNLEIRIEIKNTSGDEIYLTDNIVVVTSGSKVWDAGGADTNWTTAANWMGDVAPSAGDDVEFGVHGSSVTLVGDVSIGNLTLNREADFTMNDDGSTRTITTDGDITASAASGVATTYIINPDINLDADSTWDANTDATLTVNGAIETDGFDITFDGAGTTNINANISESAGSAAINMDGSGNLNLNGTSHTITGAFTQTDGTTTLNSTFTPGGGITLTGGTFQLGASDQIADATDLNLNGGTFSLGGNFNETIDNVTLTADSVIDFAGASGILNIDDLTLGGFTLSIHNWGGTIHAGGGAEQFIMNGTLTGSISNIRFYSDAGVTKLGVGPTWSRIRPSNEIVPAVPEPSTYISSLIILFVIGHQLHRRYKRRQDNIKG